MRITFVLPYAGISGGIRVVAIYAQRLQQRGHEVLVVSTPWKPPGIRGRIRGTLRKWAWQLNPWATGTLDPSHFDGLDVRHVQIKEQRPVVDADLPDADVVIATWWETAPWVAALSPSKGAKAYFIQHYEIHEGQPVEQVKATWRLPLHKIAVAQWLVNIAAQEYGDRDVSMVPNSVDLELFSAPPRTKQPTPTVGMMYSERSYKGSDLCIAAYQLAKSRVPDLRLVAFGTENFRTQTTLPPHTMYTRMPPQSKLREIYASCDAWLFGSRTEGFGLPLLEAMACRTPVIATPVGAAPELLAGGGGILVKPEDPQDMAAAIELVATCSSKRWHAWSNAAYATASQYTWEHATEQFEAALQRAIEKGTQQPSIASPSATMPVGAAGAVGAAAGGGGAGGVGVPGSAQTGMPIMPPSTNMATGAA